MSAPIVSSKGPIGWMAGNNVTSNIVMLFFLIGGLLFAQNIKQEVFPSFELDMIVVSVAYPGASPEEVEKGVVMPVEEAIQGLDGIAKVTSVANENAGVVTVEAVKGTDLSRLKEDISAAVDRITSFPDLAERPVITLPTRKNEVITLVVYGDLKDQVLRESAEFIRDELLQDPDITQVELEGHKDLEMSIEVSPTQLKAHGLTLAEVAQALRRASIELPGGSIKTEQGEILVRVKENKEARLEFSQIPLLTQANGAKVMLGDIAEIKDGFAETEVFLTYNGKPSISINVYRVGDQTPTQVADAVKQHQVRLQEALPEGVHLALMNDNSKVFQQRMDLMLGNAYMGLVLVFILLAIFLEARLAFWVTLGIPTAFLGSFILLALLGISINMISMFAFIITLGIVVDDAIVVGENVYQYRQQGMTFFEASVKGTQEMAMPVVFSVLTNIASFMPMFFISGIMGKVFFDIPVVVVAVFSVSLIEALFVLPAHLGHQKEEVSNPVLKFIATRQQTFARSFETWIKESFSQQIHTAIFYRYVTLTLGVVTLVVVGVFVASGRMGFTLFPKVEADYAYVEATLPYGSAVRQTQEVRDHLLQAAGKVAKTLAPGQVEGMLAKVESNKATVRVFLIDPDFREISTADFIEQWRESTGQISGLESIKFESDRGGPGSGAALSLEISHRSTQVLDQAATELARELDQFATVSDIDDGLAKGKRQFDFTLKPVAYALGLSPQEVANQVRNAFYGVEVVKQLRGRNEIKIMVRLPLAVREQEQSLQDLTLRTPQGVQVALRDVVEIHQGRAFTAINRRDGKRVVTLTADVTPEREANAVIQELKTRILPQYQDKFVGLNYSFEGKQAVRRDSMNSLYMGQLLALFGIYVLLAIPFKSYTQPLIIMVSIPFGVVGAIVGHLVMGYGLSLMSIIGVVALSGVVVNDALVLIDTANQLRREGAESESAIFEAAVSRFRPILLTTGTTFLGLAPIILETSRQAKFLIPMAISLGFGLIFSTFVVLALVPSLYMILEDIKAWKANPHAPRPWRWKRKPVTEP